MTTILSPHPKPPKKIAKLFDGVDGPTKTKRQHRRLSERVGQRAATVEFMRAALVTHHTTTFTRREQAKLAAAHKRQGLPPPASIYPTSSKTQKGNLGEVLLAEYLLAVEVLSLPVYRLHHNTNVDQAMKGDDVLAFNLDSKPPRIVVGESKFRAKPTAAHARLVAKSLLQSHQGKVPASLGFVASALYKEGNKALAKKVSSLKLAIARNAVQLDYVGFLLGGPNAGKRVDAHTPTGDPARLAMLSLELDQCDQFVAACFKGLK